MSVTILCAIIVFTSGATAAGIFAAVHRYRGTRQTTDAVVPDTQATARPPPLQLTSDPPVPSSALHAVAPVVAGHETVQRPDLVDRPTLDEKILLHLDPEPETGQPVAPGEAIAVNEQSRGVETDSVAVALGDFASQLVAGDALSPSADDASVAIEIPSTRSMPCNDQSSTSDLAAGVLSRDAHDQPEAGQVTSAVQEPNEACAQTSDQDLVAASCSLAQDIEPADQQEPKRHRRRAVHHDRRGARRAPKGAPRLTREPTFRSAARQAEARLRLAVDHIRRNIRLSIVLLRPEGFPDCIGVDLGGRELAQAFDEGRYDDIDVLWTEDLLADELRLADFQHQLVWIRSARPIHLFAAGEPDLLSVSAARPGIEHTVVCREADVDAVCAAAASAGSPSLTVLRDWPGIPGGWAVLSGYRPYKALPSTTDPRFRALDPGAGTEIQLVGGLEIRRGVYAEGRLPRVLIDPLPAGCEVFIGGAAAAQLPDGAWAASGWEEPGDHLIDLVPGPSLTYTVLSDPGGSEGWTLSNIPRANGSAAGESSWALATISGGRVCAPDGYAMLATDPSPSIVALGARANARPITRRPDVPAAVAVLPFEPAFLIVSSGRRRKEGRIIWLGISVLAEPARRRKFTDEMWASAILTATTRRLPVYPDTDAAKAAWRSAVASARRARRRKT